MLFSRFKVMFTLCLALFLVTSTATSVFADATHLFTGGYPASVVSDLRYTIDSGSLGQTYGDSIMKAGASKWNGISSKVKVTNMGDGSKMELCCGSTSTDGLFGQCISVYVDSNGVEYVDTTFSRSWKRTVVWGYDNQMNNYYFSNSEKTTTFAHETGHALSLAHTNDLATLEIMDQHRMVNGVLTDLPDSPTSIDQGHLKLKWGN